MTQKNKIYLDYAATTPVDERVLADMLPYFYETFGNSSSIHSFGQHAEVALEDARQQIAEVLNCQPAEIVFTSCGTESDNLALRGVAFAARMERNANHILISPVEHHAVLHTADQLKKLHGFDVEYLPVDETGMVRPEDVHASLRSDTALVSVIYANNEIGTINPISEIGAICHARNIPLHTDAVQGAAWLPIDVQTLNVDLLSIGAHKFYGPKGVGALFVRKGVPLLPSQTGGSQENMRRAGTHNIPYIVGMSKAFYLAQAERPERARQVLPLRDRLIGEIQDSIPNVRLTGHPSQRLPNHASFAFHGVEGNALLMALDLAGYACSSGSACKTGSPEPSEVLLACGLRPDWALGSLRVSLGTGTSPQHIQGFLESLPTLVQRNRQLYRR
ncbi:MAG: cysteine desulfurase [Anaerolineales bacterium]|nr:cysteine desulfurase [Anaerolineales bacterium]